MPEPPTTDLYTELRMALAEADTEAPDRRLRDLVVAGALSERAAGWPIEQPERIGGLETFRRACTRMGDLLDRLDPLDWSRPTIRDLTVQQLIGHLIGVEQAFSDGLAGDPSATEADHVDSTQQTALDQTDSSPDRTRSEWTAATERTLALAGERDPEAIVRFHGISLPLETLLVVRAFEMWTHEEDVERASGRSLDDPEPESLFRMTDLAASLLPAGMNRAGAVSSEPVRLVMTGPAGGAWDVPGGGGLVKRSGGAEEAVTTVVVDGAAFCRVVANRADLLTSGAQVLGYEEPARLLFRGAAALALD